MVNEISLYYDARSTKHQNLNIALPETLFVSAAVVFLRECNAASGQLAVHVCVGHLILLINLYVKGERLEVRDSKMIGSDLRCEMAGCNIVGVESTLRGLLPHCCQ